MIQSLKTFEDKGELKIDPETKEAWIVREIFWDVKDMNWRKNFTANLYFLIERRLNKHAGKPFQLISTPRKRTIISSPISQNRRFVKKFHPIAKLIVNFILYYFFFFWRFSFLLCTFYFNFEKKGRAKLPLLKFRFWLVLEHGHNHV